MQNNNIKMLIATEHSAQAQHLLTLIGEKILPANIVTLTSMASVLCELKEFHFDCLLITPKLADGTAAECLQSLQQYYRYLPTASIVIGDDIHTQTLVELIQIGASNYLLSTQLSAESLWQAIIHACEHHQHEETLVKKNQFLHSILDNISQGVCVYDQNFNLIAWNRSLNDLLQFPSGFLQVGKALRDIILFNAERGEYGDGDPLEMTNKRMAEVLNTKEIQPHCYDRVRADGTYIEVRGNRMPGGGIITTYSDVTLRKKTESMIQQIAMQDALTHLANRALFHDTLYASLQEAKINHTKVALILIDLDNFKPINDTYGHQVGDAVLKVVAERLIKCSRIEDTVARLGGDEFAVIVSNIADTALAYRPAQRILKEVCLPILVDQYTLNVGASIGICFYPDDDTHMNEIYRKADVALYQAKQNGRGVIVGYTPELDHQARYLHQLEEDLHQALEKQQISVLFQPQIDLSSNALIGAEALIRWHHPEHGVLLWHQFANIAEQSNLISHIGYFVIRTACDHLRAWQSTLSKNFRLSIKTSVHQIAHHEFLQVIRETLNTSRIHPQNLELEINEHMVMHGTEQINKRLQELRQLGTQLAIDNFGTGYTSLSQLKNYPIGRLKIDRTFIKNMCDNNDDQTIVAAIVNLAHSLQKKVTAVGIETEQQLNILKHLLCDEVQGRYFSDPLDAEAFFQWSKQHYATIDVR